MSTATDVTLIGGVVIGLMTAREFLKAGASVSVIDKGYVGNESSWAGGGILLPLYPWRQDQAISRLVMKSINLYAQLAADLVQATAIDPELNACGIFITENSDIDAAINWCTRNRIEYNQTDIGICGPDIDISNPLFLPSIAQIRNPRLLKSLIRDVIRRGGKLMENCQIDSINVTNARVNYLSTNLGNISVGELVISAGAWSTGLFDKLVSELTGNLPKIMPVKGQMLLFAAQPDTLKTMVLAHDQYLIP